MATSPSKPDDTTGEPHPVAHRLTPFSNDAAFIESVEQLILTAQPNGMVDSVNRRWQDYTGLLAEQSMGLGFARAIHPSDVNATLLTWTTSVTQGRAWQMTLRLHHHSGNPCWFLVSVTPVLDHQGDLQGWICTCTDIDRQKQVEDAQRFLVRAGVALAATLDYEATLALVGQLAVQQLADWCVIDLVDDNGTWLQKVVAHARPEDHELANRLREVRDGPPPDNLAYPPSLALRDKRSVLLPHLSLEQLGHLDLPPQHAAVLREMGMHSMLSVPLVAHDRTLGILTFGRTARQQAFSDAERAVAEDLALRAALAADNARLYRKAQQAAELREDFLSIASHELRTPLTSLLLQADGLVRSLDKETEIPRDRLHTKLHRILKQAERLQRLIENLLDVSRITRGDLGLELEGIDLVEITSEVVERFRAEAQHSHCTMHVTSDGPVRANLDRLRVEQIVTNLLSNAIRYGRGNSIEVSIATHGDNVALHVRDYGIGIDPANHGRIFEQFGRATSDRNYGGLGLGLWIVRQIVETMGGSIRVVSALGAGSTFTVVLPRGAPA